MPGLDTQHGRHRSSATSWLENKAQTQLHLTWSAEARRGRRKERLAGRLDGLAWRAAYTDAVVAEVPVRVAGGVEDFHRQIKMSFFTETERLDSPQIKIEKGRLAHAIAPGDAAVDDGAVVIVVDVALRVKADHRRV